MSRKRRGPLPETLRIEGDWKAAVAHTLRLKPEAVPAKKPKKKRKGE